MQTRTKSLAVSLRAVGFGQVSIRGRGNDAAAWKKFIRCFNLVISRNILQVAIRHGYSDKALADDLVQEPASALAVAEPRPRPHRRRTLRKTDLSLMTLESLGVNDSRVN
jgi:hypothetical protein